jgi:hypothetical protein
MPSQPVTVYDPDGNPVVMHSVDAAEAVGLGDYTYAAPGDKPDPEKLAAARAKFQGMNAELHPELMTPEQREETRRVANERAAALPEVPPGASVVVMAPPPAEPRPAPAQAKRPAGTAPAPPAPEHRER